jgi:L-Lysine epsilon oxidase N-terminal/L-lysine epsilon oxidase C-terminal domain/Iron-containing redox enzyme
VTRQPSKASGKTSATAAASKAQKKSGTPPTPPMDTFRIHPAIGIARVGNSEEYVVAPETMAGAPTPGPPDATGGLPIRAGAKADSPETIRSSDLRDSHGARKRQAARFRIFAYPSLAEESWPRGDGTEVFIGATIDGKTVQDIIWTVHVANKKANTFRLDEVGPMVTYTCEKDPQIRNPLFPKVMADCTPPASPPHAPTVEELIAVLNDPARLQQLTIDPGPRTISGRSAPRVSFDNATAASYYDAGRAEIVSLDHYPKLFPNNLFHDMDCPAGPVDTLGELLTDDGGRLLVVGGYGRAAGFGAKAPVHLCDDVNNDQWFDDTSDGPVSATVVFEDGSRATAHCAWVAATDPAYAPQILNVVSLWDDVYDCWVRQLGLAPDIYDADHGGYQVSYKPTFDDQVAPIFQSAVLQHWTTNLNADAISAHQQLADITAQDDPTATPLAGIKAVFRAPGCLDDQKNTALMPLHLGEGQDSFLTLRQTQYFFLQRWSEGFDHFAAGSGHALGPGEALDKATFVNCLGGRFSPGIDLTFVMREPALYVRPWQKSGVGPFRVNSKNLNYSPGHDGATPVLSCGYVPRHNEEGLEPGDLTKFMALPWHTDYNSCATHPPDPNPAGNRTLFWSWPAQRPVAVYAAADITMGMLPDLIHTTPVLGEQLWSIRGEGTDADDAENWGRFQDRRGMLENWHRIGVVLQAHAIDHQDPAVKPDPHWYLEVASQLDDTGRTPVQAFPNLSSSTDMDHPDASQYDPRELFYKLLNVNNHPKVLGDARAYVDYWLTQAEKFSTCPDKCPADQLFFRYTEQSFQERLELIYQRFVDEADNSDPRANRFFRTYDDVVTRIKQWAPFNLVDGAWLRNIGRTGPMDDVQAILYSIFMDELGDGEIGKNHCNIYRDLCHSVGYYPPPIESREFAFDPQFIDSAFVVPAFQLAISQFTEDYYPEILGMTLLLEWDVVQLKPTRDLLQYFGIDPHFYVMHIGIDNSVNGHGRRAADAVNLSLEIMRTHGGEKGVQSRWRRIWNGFVAFGNIPFDPKESFGQKLIELVDPAATPTLRDRVIEMIRRKAPYGSRNHQQRMLGPSRIDEWFSNPAGFLDALVQHAWITPGDWANSRLHTAMNFETGPMFRVFTDDEIALWAAYTQSLAQTSPVIPPVLPPPQAMDQLITQLRDVQQGVAGHQTALLFGPDGVAHTMTWWFAQPNGNRALMEALALPENGMITPGKPAQSRFYTQLIAPTGPMGEAFGLNAKSPLTGTYRDVVRDWIKQGAQLAEERQFSVWLTTPSAMANLHPTGDIYGMGAIH